MGRPGPTIIAPIRARLRAGRREDSGRGHRPRHGKKPVEPGSVFARADREVTQDVDALAVPIWFPGRRQELVGLVDRPRRDRSPARRPWSSVRVDRPDAQRPDASEISGRLHSRRASSRGPQSTPERGPRARPSPTTKARIATRPDAGLALAAAGVTRRYEASPVRQDVRGAMDQSRETRRALRDAGGLPSRTAATTPGHCRRAGSAKRSGATASGSYGAERDERPRPRGSTRIGASNAEMA